MSATSLRRIFPQFLAMIVQFYGAGKAAAAIFAAVKQFWKSQASQGWGMGR
jgi:hypothetical protein